MKWCELYKKAYMKETIQIQAGGKEAEQFGGAALGGAVGGKEPPAGRPTPATVEDLEGCFDSLAGVAVKVKRVLEEMVKSNDSLTITIATLTDSNARLAKNVETLTAVLAKKGGGGVEVPGREPGKYFPNCKRETCHKPDECFELKRNKDKRPRHHFRQDFHQRRCLSLFRSNSKHSYGLCCVSLLQLGQYFQVPFRAPLLRLLPS